jgi:hypothetical protein
VLRRGETLRLEVELQVAPIVAGLRAAVAADVWEILDLVRPEPPEKRPAPAPAPAPLP